ncbi:MULTISPECIES: ATP-binding protein [unclassified Arthrobacter]|uniref:ATP-binding protein n=1 Tax=unclassified Arthrobacter TaxID=235627 RepID=UPI00237C84C6|nr:MULTISPECIES: ATP-binding protein [unclassified Arthrobacter]MDD1478563.1 ATP-binding protein [Arthrobacter sp. H16F315]MDN4643930.1 ATP-binding protein [Arthrobacter sp. PsM3]
MHRQLGLLLVSGKAPVGPLESLHFITRAQDLVPYADPGTVKTHVATALVAAACR